MTKTKSPNHKSLEMQAFSRWNSSLYKYQIAYQTEEPYPHIFIDNFLEETLAEKVLKAFPDVEDKGWIHYIHVNEKKHGLNKMNLLPDVVQDLIQDLNSQEFVDYLSQLTGIDNLIADPELEGGGLHQTQNGGYLNVHADFTVHPHKRSWRRRVNLLIYFNKDWQDSYLGHLELWSRDMKRCVQKISPIFNRCVIFNTDEDSYHGLPDPIACPDNTTRKSLALYYYTKEQDLPQKKATNYRARPGDGIKAFWIYLDKQAIAIYNEMKGRLGLNDDFISSVLNFFNRKKK